MIQLPDNWTLIDGKLRRQYKFSDFKSAIAFINQVGDLAVKHNHHPEIYNVYTSVTLTLSTHEADAVTIKDYQLAEAINKL